EDIEDALNMKENGTSHSDGEVEFAIFAVKHIIVRNIETGDESGFAVKNCDFSMQTSKIIPPEIEPRPNGLENQKFHASRCHFRNMIERKLMGSKSVDDHLYFEASRG